MSTNCARSLVAERAGKVMELDEQVRDVAQPCRRRKLLQHPELVALDVESNGDHARSIRGERRLENVE